MSTFNHSETGKQAIYLTPSTEKNDDPNQLLINAMQDLPEIDYNQFDIPPELAKNRNTVYFYFSSFMGNDSFTIWFFPSGFPGGVLCDDVL